MLKLLEVAQSEMSCGNTHYEIYDKRYAVNFRELIKS